MDIERRDFLKKATLGATVVAGSGLLLGGCKTTEATTASFDLEKEIIRLVDIEALRRLQHTYNHICDDLHNPDRILSVFAEDGVWDGGPWGKAEGHEAIKELFTGFSKSVDWSQHGVSNDVIDIDGDTATCTWYIFGPYRFTGGDDYWTGGFYNNKCVKINGEWKFKLLKYEPRILVPRAAGWRDEVMNPPNV